MHSVYEVEVGFYVAVGRAVLPVQLHLARENRHDRSHHGRVREIPEFVRCRRRRPRFGESLLLGERKPVAIGRDKVDEGGCLEIHRVQAVPVVVVGANPKRARKR